MGALSLPTYEEVVKIIPPKSDHASYEQDQLAT